MGTRGTNIAKCMNYVLRGALSLPVCDLVKITFERTKILIHCTRNTNEVHVTSRSSIS